jgi:2-polyprenyl-3-methyl-5-hydroxy-6-metoxy-1,4-benzoquinol methylase
VATVDRGGHPLTTVLCRRCGLVWTNPRPSRDDVERYYATAYRADYARARTPTRRKILRGFLGAQDRWRGLRVLIRDGSRVLDVGCGAGEFVCLLRHRGIDAHGIEPGEEYAEFSRRVLGIPITTAAVDAAGIEPESQDLVTMFHVLEHVADPTRTLAMVRGWIRRGGLLVVEVPNVDSTVQAPRHRFHFAHLYSFNAATLGAIGEAAGLRLVESYLSGDGGNVTCVFRRLTDASRKTTALPENVDRMRRLFRTHTTARHYASVVPYRRALDRLVRRVREDRLLRRLPSVEAIAAWATELDAGHSRP